MLAVEDVPHAAGIGTDGVQCFGEFCDGLPRTLPANRRGAVIGAAAVTPYDEHNPTALGIAVHEIGHAMSWPHSYSRPTFEYDNPVDVMSWGPARLVDDVAVPAGTLAINRYAAGWIPDDRVAVHPGDTREYTIGPVGYDGLQLLALPSTDPKAFVTLDARVLSGVDRGLTDDPRGLGPRATPEQVEGVHAHVVDQRRAACSASFHPESCIGLRRRQAPFPLDDLERPIFPPSHAHVVPAGESLDVHGARVHVLSRSGPAFRVRVSGQVGALPIPPGHASSGDIHVHGEDVPDVHIDPPPPSLTEDPDTEAP